MIIFKPIILDHIEKCLRKLPIKTSRQYFLESKSRNTWTSDVEVMSNLSGSVVTFYNNNDRNWVLSSRRVKSSEKCKRCKCMWWNCWKIIGAHFFNAYDYISKIILTDWKQSRFSIRLYFLWYLPKKSVMYNMYFQIDPIIISWKSF